MKRFCLPALMAVAVLTADTTGEAWWRHVEYLASDNLEGRKPGTPGYEKAARYVAQQFDSLKMKPGGTNGFLQPVPLKVRRIDEKKSNLELISGGKAEPVALGREAFLASRGESGEIVEAEAVFVGYGLRVPEAGIDDLAGLDLRGKIAVVLRGAPKDLAGPLAAHAQTAAEQWRNLREAGAIGIAGIYNTARADIPWERAMLARLQPALGLAVPELVDTTGQQIALTIGPPGADRFLAGTGYSFDDLIKLDKAAKPIPKFPLRVKIRAKAVFSVRDIRADNVVGIVPGSDPKLKDEYIVFTAHLDHLGAGEPINGDGIYNGAMDNASGIATLIEVARGLEGKPLKRSVAFVAVTAEEGGLLGSKYFAYRPPVKGSVVANLNTDMYLPIIPLKAITVLGLDESDLGAEFTEAAKQWGVPAERDRQPERNAFIRSDQYSFIRRGIPALAFKFHANPGTPEADTLKEWLTKRYHAPSDDLSQPVNREGAAKFNQIMTAFLERIANRAERPAWNQASFFRRFAGGGDSTPAGRP